MASIAQLYTRGFHRDFKYYFSHWLPTSPLELGVVGELEDRYFFRPLTTLADLGIPFDPQADVVPDDSPSPMSFRSSKGATVKVKLAGEANAALPNIPQASAGIALSFSGEASFVIETTAAYEPRIRNVIALEPQILNLHRQQKWPSNYAVIYSLVRMPYADLFVSESSDSSIELEARGAAAVGDVQLGRADLGLQVKASSGRVLDLRGQRGITPAFQLMGLKKRFLQRPKVGVLSSRARMGVSPSSALIGAAAATEELPYLDLLGDD